MKKILLTLFVTMLPLVSCVKSQDVYVGSSDARQISFSPLAQPVTKAAVEGTTFPNQAMYVAAYDATAGADYFGATAFSQDGSTGSWKSSPATFWPLNTATLNFLAYSGVSSGATWDATHPASGIEIVLADNATNQYDLMYACGRQSRTSGSAATSIDMPFKHALALIKFTACTAANYGNRLKITSIVLTGAHYSGTYSVAHTGWDSATDAQSVAGAWSSVSSQANVSRTPSWDNDNAVTTTAQQVGAGILVVPDDDDTLDDYTGFTINYTIDGRGYSYNYTPADLDVHQAKKYIFAISMTLNEIVIVPSVVDYAEEGNNGVTI